METDIVYQGDCLDVMVDFPDNSIDTIITDPPYGLHFMSRNWDYGIPGVPFWKEILRVAKPGATLMAFGGTRTHHRLMVAIEDAGWEIRDCISHFHSSDDREMALLDSMNENQVQAYLELHYPNEMLAWTYGSGFPKSTSVSKQLDKMAIVDCSECNSGVLFDVDPKDQGICNICDLYSATIDGMCPECGNLMTEVEAVGWPRPCDVCGGTGKVKGAEREIVGISTALLAGYIRHGRSNEEIFNGTDKHKTPVNITTPSTPLAKQFDGYGTAMKPAFEPIIVAQKPIEKNYAYNAEKWGVSGLNIDGGRVGVSKNDSNHRGPSSSDKRGENIYFNGNIRPVENLSFKGRWPANVILSHSAGCVRRGVKRVKKQSGGIPNRNRKPTSSIFLNSAIRTSDAHHFDVNGYETTEDWECESDCAVRLLDEQSGVLTSGARNGQKRKRISFGENGTFAQTDGNTEYYRGNSKGGASRFFKNFPPARFVYSGKANRKERGEGNNHPTVKPLKVLEYLCTLTRMPTGGIVLDPFAGSGTTALAALATNRPYILIEKEAEYVEICKRRIAGYMGETIHISEAQEEAGQLTLW